MEQHGNQIGRNGTKKQQTVETHKTQVMTKSSICEQCVRAYVGIQQGFVQQQLNPPQCYNCYYCTTFSRMN